MIRECKLDENVVSLYNRMYFEYYSKLSLLVILADTDEVDVSTFDDALNDAIDALESVYFVANETILKPLREDNTYLELLQVDNISNTCRIRSETYE